MRQQIQQTARSGLALRNLFDAAPGTRLAQQQLSLSALRAQVGAAGHGAMARAASSPAGQQALGQLYAARGQSSLAQFRQQLAEGKAREAYEASPEGRRTGA